MMATNVLTDEVRRFLQDRWMAVVATINNNGTPQQTVVWYMLRNDELVMNTRRGRVKDRNLQRDPRLSITIAADYRYVVIRGTARLIDDQATALEDDRQLAMRYMTPEEAEEEVRQHALQERVSLYVQPERVFMYGF